MNSQGLRNIAICKAIYQRLMIVDKARRSGGRHVQRLYETTMMDELSKYFSKYLIASDLRKDDMKFTTQTM